jgi:hypothetical protein
LPFPSLVCSVRAHRSTSCVAGVRHRRPEAPPHPRRSPSFPEFTLEVSNLPMSLFRQVAPQCPHNCSPELVASPWDLSTAVCVLRCLCRCCAHGRVRQIALSTLEVFLEPLEPRRDQSPRLQRALTARSTGATAPASGRQPLDLGRPSEIEQFRLNQSGSNLSLLIQIRLLSSLPLTRTHAAGPSWSARPGSLKPRPRLPVASAHSRPRARPQDIILSVDL